ncbi:hypothetical protein EOA16_25095 [Mesorhizobium sp. M7A.F.Ca.US.008.03.1.1]|nr:hypothetical protein EOA16_25095 [Mesorhizobium sp. M7A.F.Ca.US.008.03.1.1]
MRPSTRCAPTANTRKSTTSTFPSTSTAAETVWKRYSGGHLKAFSALPVLTDLNVRCAPVLETTII